MSTAFKGITGAELDREQQKRDEIEVRHNPGAFNPALLAELGRAHALAERAQETAEQVLRQVTDSQTEVRRRLNEQAARLRKVERFQEQYVSGTLVDRIYRLEQGEQAPAPINEEIPVVGAAVAPWFTPADAELLRDHLERMTSATFTPFHDPEEAEAVKRLTLALNTALAEDEALPLGDQGESRVLDASHYEPPADREPPVYPAPIPGHTFSEVAPPGFRFTPEGTVPVADGDEDAAEAERTAELRQVDEDEEFRHDPPKVPSRPGAYADELEKALEALGDIYPLSSILVISAGEQRSLRMILEAHKDDEDYGLTHMGRFKAILKTLDDQPFMEMSMDEAAASFRVLEEEEPEPASFGAQRAKALVEEGIPPRFLKPMVDFGPERMPSSAAIRAAAEKATTMIHQAKPVGQIPVMDETTGKVVGDVASVTQDTVREGIRRAQAAWGDPQN